MVLEELIKCRDEASSTFYKYYFDLEQKKDKAFSTPNLGGPGVLDPEALKIPKEDLIKNKLVTKTLMYQDETAKLHQAQKFFAYLNNQLSLEVAGFRDLKTKRYIRILTELSNLQMEQLTEVTFLITSEPIKLSKFQRRALQIM